MCGRYALAGTDADELRARFGLGEQVEVRRRYNICPTDDVLTVAAVGREASPSGRLMRWGLIPHWADSPAVGARMINARAESLADKPAFAPALRSKRCLIVADGFYEWQARAGARRKQPFHITREHGEPFAFAGLWASWRATADDPWLTSCAIITRAAGSELAAIHNRQPVILPGPDAEQAWLDPDTPVELAQELLREPVALHARAVGFAVSDVRCDGPACLDPPAGEGDAPTPGIEPGEQGTLL